MDLTKKEQSKWLVIAIFAAVIVAIIYVARFSNIPTPLRAGSQDVANKWWEKDEIVQQHRDLSTPSSRLVGHWVGQGTLYYQPIDHSLGYGTFTWKLPTDVDFVGQFKILSESDSGDYLKTREYLASDSLQFSAIAEYCIPKSGQSMTKEMVWDSETRYLYKFHPRYLYKFYYFDGRVDPSSR